MVFNTTEERAYELMDLAHNGEQNGIGRVSWDSLQRDIILYKRGKSVQYKTAFQICPILNLKRKKDFINGPSYTDLERIFGSKAIKNLLNINDDYSVLTDNLILDIKVLFYILKEAKKDLSFNSYSRFFHNIDESNSNMQKFISYYEEHKSTIELNLRSKSMFCNLFESENEEYEEYNTPQEQNEFGNDNSHENEKEPNNQGELKESENDNEQKEEKESDNEPNNEDESGQDGKKESGNQRRQKRVSLIVDCYWESKYLKKFPQPYIPILSLIINLRSIHIDEDKIPDNTLVLALILRALLDQSSKAYSNIQKIQKMDDKIDLRGSIGVNKQNMIESSKMSKEIAKSLKVDKVDRLQAYVHHYNAKLSQNDLIELFDTFKPYIEICLDTIQEIEN